MTNDTSTLNGSLVQLGETLASNITQKGVTASASDGLTTLANKVLQITGGGSTTLYYDPCTDNTKLGNYTTIIRGEGGNCTTTWVEYDSTENAMKLTNCDNKTKSLQISALDGLNNFTLEADIKLGGSSSQSFECGFAITNSTTALCGIMLQRTSNFTTFNYHNQGWDGETNATSHSDFIGEWTHLKVTVEDLDITVEVTNVNGVTKSFTKSLSSSYYTVNSMQFGICLASDYSQHSWIKNIKAETIGGSGSTVLWQPSLDGTDSMSDFGTGTRYVDFTDGVCTCAKYCFDDDWDNSIDWEMTFDINCLGQYSNANNGVEIIESTQTAPDHYCLAILADAKYFTNYIPSTIAVGETISNIAKNTWVSVRVTKVGTTLKVYFNDTLFETYTNCEWSRSKLAFHSWGSNYTQIKNVIVKSISNGSDCSSYQTEINNAIEYINGSGS